MCKSEWVALSVSESVVRATARAVKFETTPDANIVGDKAMLVSVEVNGCDGEWTIVCRSTSSSDCKCAAHIDAIGDGAELKIVATQRRRGPTIAAVAVAVATDNFAAKAASLTERAPGGWPQDVQREIVRKFRVTLGTGVVTTAPRSKPGGGRASGVGVNNGAVKQDRNK